VTGHDLVSQDLLGHIGSTLRRRRELAGLTQAELAGKVATSQATVARIEHGDRAPSVAMLERLFAALGCQVRLTLEPLDRDVDDTIAALTGVPVATRVEEAGIPRFADDLAPIPYVFAGATAALLQGAPVPADAMDVALAWRDTDAFIRWLDQRYASRWHDGYQEFGYRPIDPRLPGERRWRIRGGVVVRARFDDELPASIEVRYGDRGYPVLPLAEVEVDDPPVARLLRRHRDRRPTG
jgi:transcriptional regulator with XRE-family HTH domain